MLRRSLLKSSKPKNAIKEYHIYPDGSIVEIQFDKRYKYVDMLLVGFGNKGTSFSSTDYRCDGGHGGGSGEVIQILSIDLSRLPYSMMSAGKIGGKLTLQLDKSDFNPTIEGGSISQNGASCSITTSFKERAIYKVFGDYTSIGMLSISIGGGMGGSGLENYDGSYGEKHGGGGGASFGSSGNSGYYTNSNTNYYPGDCVTNNNECILPSYWYGGASVTNGKRSNALYRFSGTSHKLCLNKFIKPDRIGTSGKGGEWEGSFPNIYGGSGGGAAGVCGKAGNGKQWNGKKENGNDAEPTAYGAGGGGGHYPNSGGNGGDAAVFLRYHNDDPSFN